jgi:hypothetical protein
MFIDSGTLQDLEIVPMPTARGTTLWSLVNRTKSRVGSQALRERLLNPPHTADEILALQRAHQVLAADAKAYRDTLDRAAADNVERYLNATWQLPRDMPPLIRFRKWYRQYLQDVERGRLFVTSLLECAADLRGRLAQTNAAILEGLRDEIGALLETAAAQELRGLVSQGTSASFVGFDQLARGDAKCKPHRLAAVRRQAGGAVERRRGNVGARVDVSATVVPVAHFGSRSSLPGPKRRIQRSSAR